MTGFFINLGPGKNVKGGISPFHGKDGQINWVELNGLNDITAA